MSKQYDYNPGLDLSSLTSANLSQTIQAISQIVPLSNIGGIVVQAGDADGLSGHPDVIQNPRFIKYLWIDTETPLNPVIKKYTGNRDIPVDDYTKWEATAAANDSITGTMLQAGAVSLFDNVTPKIANLETKAVAALSAGLILRLDSNGQYVELASLDNIVAPAKISLDALKMDPASGVYSDHADKFLKINAAGNAINWQVWDPTLITDLSITSAKLGPLAVTNEKIDAGIGLDKVLPNVSPIIGTKYQVPRVNLGVTLFEFWTPPVLQLKSVTYSAEQSSAGYFPDDATIPQITEGNGITGDALDITITPLLSAGFIHITGILHLYVNSTSTAARLAVALFKDAVAASVGVFVGAKSDDNGTATVAPPITSIPIDLEIAHTGTAITIKPRFGCLGNVGCIINPGTIKLGAAYVSRLQVEEIVKS